MKNPSGSTLQRTDKCPAWLALPHVKTTSEDAERGTAGHAYLANVAQLGREEALKRVPEQYQSLCAAIDLDGLPLGPECKQEVAYAYNVETGEARLIGYDIGREYGELADTEIPCSLDVVEGDASVADWKFDGSDSHAPPPAVNPQLKLGVLCTGGSRVRLIHFREDGSHWQESAEIDEFEKETFRLWLKDLLKRVRAAQASTVTPDVTRGSHCKYCPAATHCPAVTGLIRSMAANPMTVVDEIKAALADPATASRAYRKWREAQEALKLVGGAIHAFASENAIDAGGGMVYGPVVEARDDIKPEVARSVMVGLYGHDIADLAFKFDTSKAAIKRALDVAHELSEEKVTKKALLEKTLAAIDAAGGIEKVTRTVVKERRVRVVNSNEEAA